MQGKPPCKHAPNCAALRAPPGSQAWARRVHTMGVSALTVKEDSTSALRPLAPKMPGGGKGGTA